MHRLQQRRPAASVVSRPPAREHRQLICESRWIPSPRVVGRPGRARPRGVPHESAHACRVVGRQEQTRRHALAVGAQHRRPGFGSIENRAQVGGPRLEVGRSTGPARQSEPPAIMQDQTRERRQILEERLLQRELPAHLDADREVELPGDVDRAFAHHLVGDIGAVAGLHVARFGNVHPSLGPGADDHIPVSPV